nr:transposase [Endozoicomonas ascidiicola]
MRLERARLYGRSSEKFSGQGEIFNEAELTDCAVDPDEDGQEETEESPKPLKKCKGRKPLSPSLPRVQERIELTEEEKQGAIETFFTKVREELDIIPARVQIKEIMQEKAVFIVKDEQGGESQEKRIIKAAELPKHPIPKPAVTVSMLAWIIVAKYCDALPLYRQVKILARYGGSITRTTMANWMIRLSLQLQPLINLMEDHQRIGHIMNADETRIQVLKELSKSLNSDKYMWVTRGGPLGQPAVLFHYDPSRGKEASPK